MALSLAMAPLMHQDEQQNNSGSEDCDDLPFWKSKSLAKMSPDEWESLCDGCGRCCLNKLEDWDTGEIIWTNIACTLLDGRSCRCKDYENRFDIVPDCLQLTPKLVAELSWLPPTCAYRLLDEGEELPWWHPLISGDPATVERAGISIKDRTIPEDGMSTDDYEDYLVKWPKKVPKQSIRNKII